MELGELDEQIVLISQKAFEHIHFKGYEISDSGIYYSKKTQREKRANEFNKMHETTDFAPDDLYILDILREEVKADESVYDESTLEYAMDNLGSALDYVTNFLNLDGQEFLSFFLSSGVAREFEQSNPRYVTCISGRDMADEVYRIVGKNVPEIQGEVNGDYSQEYWCGWILAYYQGYTHIEFSKILPILTFEKLMESYILHETNKMKVVEVFDKAVRAETFLARVRKKRNFTQAELAAQSGVSLRSIQLYGQRKNDINKAQYNNLKDIANVLSCDIEDIVE